MWSEFNRNQNYKKYPKLKKQLKSFGIEVIKPRVRKNGKQKNYGCSRKKEVIVIFTESFLQFTTISLKVVYVQNF